MDIICPDDLDAFGSELDDPLAELAQDMYHTELEAHGSNLDDPDRGLGLADVLSSTLDAVELRARIEAGLRRDPRIAAVQATITVLEAGAFRVDVLLEADNDELSISTAADGQGGLTQVT